MKACNKCGGIKATENLEIIAGTTCKCSLDVGVIVKLADIDKVIEDKMKKLCSTKQKFIIESDGFINYPEKTIRISISKYNELLNNPEWKLLDIYIKDGYQTYSWINKKTGKIIKDGTTLDQPSKKLTINY